MLSNYLKQLEIDQTLIIWLIVIGVILFASIVIYIFRPKKKKYYDKVSHLALEDDEDSSIPHE